MRIQELEQQVGIERATIRYYEKEGLIDPKRSENGYRDYSENDAEELRRIRLLRDLGVSLDTIKKLQQGSVDMASVMARQSEALRSRREQLARAQAVCDQITADGASYQGLDTVRYQNLLTEPPQAPAPEKSVFRDHVRQPHPWRRYLARSLDNDLVGALVWFFIVAVLRLRPAGNGLNFASVYLSLFVVVPLEALCLHLWGATPGKWICGIQVESLEGGRLSFHDALRRAWRVLYHGLGFNVPVFNIICLFRGYTAHRDVWDTEWDDECEITFGDCYARHVLVGILMCVVSIGLSVAAELDAELPKYRSNELTVSQFADNFNFYDQYLQDNTTEHMNSRGVLEKQSTTRMIGWVDGDEVEYDPVGQFRFETSGDTIQRITYHHSWYEYDRVSYYTEIDTVSGWLPSHCRVAMETAILSQKGLNRKLLRITEEKLWEDLSLPASSGQEFNYGAVTMSWDLDLEPYYIAPDGSYYSDIYYVTLDMTIEWA